MRSKGNLNAITNLNSSSKSIAFAVNKTPLTAGLNSVP